MDNKEYDRIVKIENSDFNKALSFDVEHWGNHKMILILAPFFTPIDSFVVPHTDGLFLMLNDVLCIFNPSTLEIDRQSKIDSLGTMFEVHQFEEDYILYGELEIYRISSALSVQWKFSGRDIFVRYSGNEPAFIMKEDRICLYDFEDNYYEIDYDGKIISEWMR